MNGLERTVSSIAPLEDEFKNISGEAELKEVWLLDQLAYGKECISHEGLRAWWKVYPKGIYVLWKCSEIAGAVGIWPIKKSTYDRITRGDIDEVEITAKDIRRNVPGETYAYWYFADIVIRKEHRHQPQEWHLFLIEEAIKQWSSEGNLAPEIHLTAFGFTPAGESLLKTFRFLCVSYSRKGKPVYQRTVGIDDIYNALRHLNIQRKKLRKYDVFISYRRNSVSGLAEKIHDELEKRNLKVFMDREDLYQGEFDTLLCEAVDEAQYFILILSPGCLDKRTCEVDYFRKEIALATDQEKKIIPIMMKEFTYPIEPDWLDYIQRLSVLNHIEYTPDTLINDIMDFINSAEHAGAYNHDSSA